MTGSPDERETYYTVSKVHETPIRETNLYRMVLQRFDSRNLRILVYANIRRRVKVLLYGSRQRFHPVLERVH